MSDFKTITELARSLRKNQTPSEEKLWQELRNRKLDGYKFLRQHPIIHGQFMKRLLFFIADFYCWEKKLVLELDGGIHKLQKEYDEQRDLILKNKGLKILRIENEETNDMERLKQKLRMTLQVY
jgi:very-short-patch-repair endonuclease